MNGQGRLGVAYRDKGPDQISGQLRFSTHPLFRGRSQLGGRQSRNQGKDCGPKQTQDLGSLYFRS